MNNGVGFKAKVQEGLAAIRAELRSAPVFWGVVAALAIALTVVGAVRAQESAKATSDFNGFWDGGHAVLTGGNLKKVPAVRRYLPFFSIVMAPFALFPMRAAAALWQLVSIAALLALFWMTWDLASRKSEFTFRRALLFGGLATATYWWDHMALCQVSGVAAATAIIGLWLVRRGHPWLGGMAVAAGASFKIFPGILFPVFLFTRQWKAAAGFVVGFALCCAISIPIFGPAKAIDLHKSWFREEAATAGIVAFVEKGRSFRYNNTSLAAVLVRTLMEVNAGSPRKPIEVHVANLDVKTVERIARGIQLALFAGLAALCLRARALRVEEAAFALAVTAFFLPIAWTFHQVTLIPAFVVLVCSGDRTAQRFAWVAGGLQLAVVSPYTRAAGGLLLANLVLLAGLAHLAWRTARASKSEPAGAPT